jgi:transcriptional regulator with XRE-family HTH domain
MTAEPDRRTVAARLAAERTRRGLTKRELGRRLASQVTEQCPSLDTLVSYVKRWEAGKVSVSDRYRHAYSKALGMSPADLFGRADPEDPRMCDGGDMERRRLLLATLGLGAFAASASLTALTDLALTSEPRDVADWQLAVADHLHGIRTRPPAQARDDLIVDLLRLRQQLSRAGRDGIELRRVLAALAALYGGLLTRLGEHGAALRWWRTACHAADDAADLELRLLVRAESAGFGLYGQRDPATVLRLLDDTERIAGRSRSVWRADLNSTRAKALSLLGRHGEARAAVNVLLDTVPDAAPASPIPTLWTADQAYFAESWVLAAAGDEAGTSRAVDRVLSHTGDYQYVANVSLHGALCTVVSGGTAAGTRRAAQVLDGLPPGYRSQMITETGRRVLAAVPRADQDSAPARDLAAVIAATAPPAAQLAG